jgi:hypothetical protein
MSTDKFYAIIDALAARVEALEQRVAVLQAGRAAAPAHAPAAAPADEPVADLDSEYGDPEVRRDPPRWKGESMVGKHYSECSPEYLGELAGFKRWCASRDDEQQAVDAKGRPKSYWARLDAARAAGWAARILAAQPRKEERTSSSAARERHRAAAQAIGAAMGTRVTHSGGIVEDPYAVAGTPDDTPF